MEQGKPFDLQLIKAEVQTTLSDDEVKRSLLATTFKGLDELNVRKAIFEGLMRGFTVQDFVVKNVYAVPFKDGYALVTSIDYCRKRGMKNGVCGTDAPIYTYEEQGEGKKKKIESCTVTVHRLVNGHVGAYTATVFFDEYNTGKNQWVTRPHTMIAKVAEVHANRKACPDDLSQFYIEDEMTGGDQSDIHAEASVIATEERIAEAKAAIPAMTMRATLIQTDHDENAANQESEAAA